MNTNAMHKIVQLGEQSLQELTNEVKETVAVTNHFKKNKSKSFSVVDMWNCQKQARSASDLFRR
jgi:hypothetical protein